MVVDVKKTLKGPILVDFPEDRHLLPPRTRARQQGDGIFQLFSASSIYKDAEEDGISADIHNRLSIQKRIKCEFLISPKNLWGMLAQIAVSEG